eukprot:1918484-Prymnesium_polylepis.1
MRRQPAPSHRAVDPPVGVSAKRGDQPTTLVMDVVALIVQTGTEALRPTYTSSHTGNGRRS